MPASTPATTDPRERTRDARRPVGVATYRIVRRLPKGLPFSLVPRARTWHDSPQRHTPDERTANKSCEAMRIGQTC